MREHSFDRHVAYPIGDDVRLPIGFLQRYLNFICFSFPFLSAMRLSFVAAELLGGPESLSAMRALESLAIPLAMVGAIKISDSLMLPCIR